MEVTGQCTALLTTARGKSDFHMALWQFVFDLIPTSAATVDGVVAARMNRDQLDAIELNFSQKTIEAIVENIGMVLPEKESWAPDLRIWGDEKTDDVQVGMQGSTIEFAQFRLNVADISLPLVGGICTLARDCDCVFSTRGGAIIRPYSEALIRAVTQSDAARYVIDPERYLREATRYDQVPKSYTLTAPSRLVYAFMA